MSSPQGLPAIAAAGSSAPPKEATVHFDLQMKSSWGQALPVRVRSDFNINDVREQIAKTYAWAPKKFRLLLQGQEPRLELTLKDLGIEESSILHMQSSSPASFENESIYRELSHVLSEAKKAESQWRCTKATPGVARSGLLQSMHDPNKGVSDFSEFMKQRMGEVREFSSDWSKFNQALHRYEKSVNTLGLESIGHAVAANIDTNSYIRSVENISGLNEDHRVKRVSAPQLKELSSHRSPKSKTDQGSSGIDRELLLKEARQHQYLVKTDFMHKAQAQFLQQQMDNLQKIIVDKGPLEVDPAKVCKRMEIACTLPWDDSLHRGYRESPDWLQKQRQTIEIPGEEKTIAKTKVPTEPASRAVVTVTFDIQEDNFNRPILDSSIGSIYPPSDILKRTEHISPSILNRCAMPPMRDAASISASFTAKYGGAKIDFRPPQSDSRRTLPSPVSAQHSLQTPERAVGIRTPIRANALVTKRGLSKDWRER
jgi:hypothetical protein